MIQEITVKTALNKLRRGGLPYAWDLNIYRGCSHHCQYCYAQYSHQYLAQENFFGNLLVKTNIAECLDKQLASKTWKHAVINLGGVTDSYQPIEAQYALMRQVLPVFIKHRNPLVLSTKSDLILRDLDLITALAKVASVVIMTSVTTMDEPLRRRLEPGAVTSSLQRLAMLKAIKAAAGVTTGVLMMPILPYFNDTEKNFMALFKEARRSQVDFVMPGLLNLRSQTKKHWLAFVQREYPDHYAQYLALYRTGKINPEYRRVMYATLNRVQQYYGLPKSLDTDPPRRAESPQLTLF